MIHQNECQEGSWIWVWRSEDPFGLHVNINGIDDG